MNVVIELGINSAEKVLFSDFIIVSLLSEIKTYCEDRIESRKNLTQRDSVNHVKI